MSKRFINVKTSVFNKIFIFFLIPTVIISMIYFLTYIYYQNGFHEEAKNHYQKALLSTSETIENMLQELYQTNNMLSSDPYIQYVINHNNTLKLSDQLQIHSCWKLLSKFRTTRQIIYRVYIYHKKENLIISSDGTINADFFYNDVFKYYSYDKQFWDNFSIDKIPAIVLLPPSKTSDGVSEKNVIPMVQTGIGEIKTKNLFVIDLNELELRKILEKDKLTPNSFLLITDDEGNVFSSTDNINTLFEDTNSIKQLALDINSAESSSFNYSFNNNKYLVVKYNSKSNLKKLLYVAFIPQTDLNQKSAFMKITALSSVFLCVLLSIVLAYLLSKIIYRPLNSLIGVFLANNMNISKDAILSKDEFEFLNKKIATMIHDTDHLQKELSITLPLACEQYLLKVLTNSQKYLQEEVILFLNSHNIHFQYDYFSVIIIQLDFNDKFFVQFTKEEQRLIHNGMLHIIKSIFVKEYYVHILPMDNDRLCIILNLPDDVKESNLEEAVQYLHSLCEFDKEFMDIYSGIGRINKHISSMPKSYHEAYYAVSSIPCNSKTRIKTYENSTENTRFQYSLDEENKLYNYLTGGYKNEAVSLYESIIGKNVKLNISQSDMRDLYQQLYHTGMRVIKNRDIDINNVLVDDNIKTFEELNYLEIHKIKKYFIAFLSKIAEACISCGKINTREIIDFIQKNYSKDIYLEVLAGQYHTSPKYLSKLLKDTLGIPFQQYLARLRIDEAKRLLAESDKTINEISSLVGFNSHNTFFRMFKNMEGITPSQYRNIHQKS